MDVRWGAVLAGFMADYLITGCIVIFANPGDAFFQAPDPTRLDHITYMALFILSTGVGGYLAGRLSSVRGPLHGLLVGVVGILIGQIQTMATGIGPARPFVVASAIGCLIGALGGALAMLRFPKRT